MPYDDDLPPPRTGIEGYFLNDPHAQERVRRRGSGMLERWDTEVGGTLPTRSDLETRYSGEDPYAASVIGPERSEAGAASADAHAQMEALDMLREQARTGGFTRGEREMMGVAERQQTQMARGQREAAQQQLEARGMGGSGLSLVSSQMAGEAATQRASDFDAQMAQQAALRQLQAIQSYGQLGSQVRGQSFDESFGRGSAVDDFNYRNTDYRRGVQERNTDRRNTQERDRRDAAQQEWENRYRSERDRADLETGGLDRETAERWRQQDRDDARTEQLLDTGTSIARTAAG